jgi:hypothetical protein
VTRARSLAAGLLLACEPLPDVTQVGAHVEIAADRPAEVCGGTLAHMDDFVARLAAELSRPAPTGRDRLRFYWLEADGFHARSGCPETATACSRGAESFARTIPLDHELVHGVAHPLGVPLPLFAEGLAVAYEGLRDSVALADDGAPSEALPDLDVRELLTARTGTELFRGGGYQVAGAFTSFLIARHGIAAYLRAYARIDRRDDRQDVDRVFREVLGASFEQSAAEFEDAAGECGPAAWHAKLAECGAPELEWRDGSAVLYRGLDCSQADVVGPFGGEVVAFHTLTIEVAGDYELRVLGDVEAGRQSAANEVSLTACGGCGLAELVIRVGDGPVRQALARGRYAVRVSGPAGQQTAVGLRVTPLPG